MKYKNYIFDLYGTLIDIHTDEESLELWEYMTEYLKQHFDTITTATKLKNDYVKICAEETAKLAEKNGSQYPEIKIEWVWNRLIAGESDASKIQKLCTTFREKSRDKLVCYNNVHNVLEQIKNEGGHVYLLSNAQRLFTQKELDDTNLTKYFDDIFISSDKGVKKPDSTFINELLEKHSLIKSETVMIGNEIKSDIGSAVAAGIDGIYLNTYSHTQQELDSELSAINFDKSNITLTIIDNGENCVDMLEI